MDALSETVAPESFSIISSTSWCLLSASFCISAMSGIALGPSIYERYLSMNCCHRKLTTDLKKIKGMLQPMLAVFE
jgi:Na+/proline symporter